MRENSPKRGEIYYGDLDPVIGHEQAGRRPVLIVSIEPMNRSSAGLAITVPLTTTPRENLFHVRIEPGQTGLDRVSYAMPEMVRILSLQRLQRRVGRVPGGLVDRVAANFGVLVGLGRTKS